MYTIREVGGLATNAYVDGRNKSYSANEYYKSGIKHITIEHFCNVGIEIEAIPYQDTWHYGNIIETILNSKER